MFKKTFIVITVLITSVVGMGLLTRFAVASINIGPFVFTDTTTSPQNKTYYVDVVPGNSLATAAGKYNVEALLGFYGTNLSNDSYYSSNLYNIAHLKIRLKGQQNYIGTLGENSYGGGSVAGSTTGEEYQTITERSSTNGFAVDPGEYTIDVVRGSDVLSTTDVCLPTFTSSSGITIGNVTCNSGAGLNPQVTPPNNSTTPTPPAPAVPGPYTGKFTFPALPTGGINVNNQGYKPAITCTTTDCTFKIDIKGTQTGNVATVLQFYPKADRDAGGTKGFTLNGYSYSVKAYTGKTYPATITVPVSALQPKMDAMQAPDRNYYVSFVNVTDLAQESGKAFYDFGSALPAATPATISFNITSLLAPATTATIKGNLVATATTSEKLDLYVWPTGGTAQKIQTTPNTTITTQGTPITFTVPSLQASTTYSFKLVTVSSGVEVYSSNFSTNISSDQAVSLTAVDGACGPAINDAQATEPTAQADLCDAGDPSTVSGSSASGWDWTCAGTDGGAPDDCHADSLSSGNAAECGAADGTTRADMPSAQADLCNNGDASSVTVTNAGWDWTCTLQSSNDQKSCSATKTGANPGPNPDPESPDKPSNFLQNPFKTLDSFPKIIKAVVNNIILPIAIPFIGVMIMYSGFLFVVARRSGNTDGLKKAKETLTYTLIGAALVLGAFVIANALQGTLNSLVSTSYSKTHNQPRV
ncbi:MAG: pilin [bacterium]